MAIKKDLLISGIKTRLQTIKDSADYHTNVGDNIYEGRTAVIPSSNLPAINILEGNDNFLNELTLGVSQIHERILELDFELLADGETVTTILRQVEADLFKAIGVDPTIGGLAITAIPGDVVTVYDKQQEKKMIGKIATIGFQYRTAAWQNE